jgi:chemotaxis protein MotB
MAELRDLTPEAAPAPIIIKKIKKHAGGHHGGAWKVAYADFVTAMMAFFLLLWLLNATTEEQKMGISNYFAPASPSATNSGSGKPLGGLTLSVEGAMQSSSSPVGVVVSIPRPKETELDDDEETDDNPFKIPEEELLTFDGLGEEELSERFAEIEEAEFAKAEKALRQAIAETPELEGFANNVVIDRTPEGMRIQIVDQTQVSMFPRGSSAMYKHTQALMDQVAKVIGNLPNRIAITGHTDATKYANPDGYGNWELSADRANASRRALLDMGLPARRIALVMGKSDREPLIKDNPKDPRNRRIGIVLLHETYTPPKNQPKKPAKQQAEADSNPDK